MVHWRSATLKAVLAIGALTALLVGSGAGLSWSSILSWLF